MKFTYEDLFQKPYYFKENPFGINPFISTNINYVKRLEEYPFYFFETLMSEPKKDYGSGLVENGLNFGHGTSFKNPEEAMKKSIFEAFERKFSKAYAESDLVFDSYSNLKHKAVNPHQFSLPTLAEYKKRKLPYVKYNHKLAMNWKQCLQILPDSLKPTLIPASLVYSRYSWKNKEERIAPTLSPGISCHLNYRNSVLNGLLELIERDAFMVTWLKTIACPQITIDSSALGEAEEVFKHIESLGFEITFVNISTDVDIPVILTIIENPYLKWNGTMAFGLGCELAPLKALKKSFLECLQGLSNYLSFDYNAQEIVINDESICKKFNLSNEVYFAKTHFLKKSKKRIKIEDIPNHDQFDSGKNLEYMVAHLNAKNLETYFIDLTPKELKEEAFCLTRAFIGGIQPMLYDVDCLRLSNNRAFTAQSQMGIPKLKKKIISYSELNLSPHPFAGM